MKILGLAGSTRAGSFNKKLVNIALQSAAKAGATVELIDLRDFNLPMYDGDLEESKGLPADARRLKDLFLSANGFLISSPEYNSSYSGVLKNAIDWLSRPVPTEKPLECFANKIAGIMGASPGKLGCIRMLPQLRLLLSNILVHVVPEQFGLAMADAAFNAQGQLNDAGAQQMVENIGKRVVEVARKLHDK